MGKFEHLAGHGVVHAVDARDAVANRNDASDLRHVDVDGIAADLLADNLRNLVSFDVHAQSCRLLAALPFNTKETIAVVSFVPH